MTESPKLYTFNGLQLLEDGQTPSKIGSRKAEALLSYLVLNPKPQPRDVLADLLWDDRTQQQAMSNLRRELSELRKKLAPYLRIERDSVTFDSAAGLWVDAHVLKESIHKFKSAPSPDLAIQLAKDLDIYSGPLLAGFYVREASRFDDWLFTEREHWHHLITETLEKLVTFCRNNHCLTDAIPIGRRLIQLDPLVESGYQLLMQINAQLGKRNEALEIFKSCKEILFTELGVEPDAETIRLFEIIRKGEIERVETISLDSLVSNEANQILAEKLIPFQAQPLMPHYVERETETAEIERLILEQLATEAPETRHSLIIAPVGMGGIGKTALATYLAHRLQNHFADGVLWGNPATSDPLSILDLWATAYGHDFSQLNDLQSKSSAVRDLLSTKQTLIVLDNVDQAEEVRRARYLLPNHHQCVVLLTTRSHEVAASLNARPIEIRELTSENSEKLLTEILGEDRVHKTPAETKSAIEIAQHLHHLPLALEIAAQRLRSRPSMPLASMANRLAQSKQRLGLKITDQEVRTSFLFSWEGLNQTAKSIFMAMGLFAGRNFNADSIASIVQVAEPQLSLFDVEDELYGLATLSLVKSNQDGRFHQHRLLADFAAEQLEQQPELLATYQQRLITFYLNLVSNIGIDFERLSPEWGQLEAVFDIAYQTQAWRQLIQLSEQLTPAWEARGRYSEARRGYALAQDAAKKLESMEQEAEILLGWGRACLEQNEYADAKDKLEEGLALYHRLEEGDGIAQALYHLARIAIEQNRFVEARELLNQSKGVLEGFDSRIGMGDIHLLEGVVAITDGFQLDEAEPVLNQALDLFKSSGNLIGTSDTLRALAHVALKKQDLELAESLALEAKGVSEKLKNRSQLASNLFVLTVIYRGQGKLDQAESAGEASLAIVRQTGEKQTEALILRQLSHLHASRGDYQTALDLTHQSLVYFQNSGILLSQAFTMEDLAVFYQKSGDFDEAKRYLDKAELLAKQLSHISLISKIGRYRQEFGF